MKVVGYSAERRVGCGVVIFCVLINLQVIFLLVGFALPPATALVHRFLFRSGREVFYSVSGLLE
jgi:hypothetical protein